MTRPNAFPVFQHLLTLLTQGTTWAASGDDPRLGCSCYGLVRYAYAQAGIVLPGTPEEAEVLFTLVPLPYEPWDVLLWNFEPWHGPRHLALLLTPMQGIHSSASTNGLARFRLTDGLVQRVLTHAWRYKGWACT